MGKSSPLLDEHLQNKETKPNGIINSGGGIQQLNKMKHMGQLWLAAEVRALESRVGGKAALSPYLVLDADALIKYTFMVKNLVHARKFIVLVPSVGKPNYMCKINLINSFIDSFSIRNCRFDRNRIVYIRERKFANYHVYTVTRIVPLNNLHCLLH